MGLRWAWFWFEGGSTGRELMSLTCIARVDLDLNYSKGLHLRCQQISEKQGLENHTRKSKPLSKSALTISTWPFLTASMRGVTPV